MMRQPSKSTCSLLQNEFSQLEPISGRAPRDVQKARQREGVPLRRGGIKATINWVRIEALGVGAGMGRGVSVAVLGRVSAGVPFSRRRHRCDATSQMRRPPSAVPTRRELSRRGLRPRQVTPSGWGRARMNGFAKTRSSFAAFSARVYSVAFSKGCSAGSRFRCTFCKSEVRSRVYASSERLMHLTFIRRAACARVGAVASTASAGARYGTGCLTGGADACCLAR